MLRFKNQINHISIHYKEAKWAKAREFQRGVIGYGLYSHKIKLITTNVSVQNAAIFKMTVKHDTFLDEKNLKMFLPICWLKTVDCEYTLRTASTEAVLTSTHIYNFYEQK